MQKFNLKQKGFTLIEILVALAIMSMLMLSVANMVLAMSVQERKNKAITEVDTAASSVMDDITQSLRNASFIAFPATSTVSSTTLTLATAGVVEEDPTTFS
ncbi:MAG: prepilin-type N-terminal cleavage/methylation domain-containing protein, partial [Patescibacteria group bacterium]